MSVFYNEHDKYAAQWLRNLIDAGHIAPGIVSEEDVRDLDPAYLKQFVQCHFFAGIGVWSFALRQAGWPDDKPIWTGSCPCQPFSAAGQRGGVADERHLWPAFHWLIDQCRPAIVVGEQVASKDGLGWLDLVSADLEGSGYAFGASDLCAAGVGGAHIRQRLYFVGLVDPDDARLEGRRGAVSGVERTNGQAAPCGPAVGLADMPISGRREERADGRGFACGDSPQRFSAGLSASGGDMRTHAPMLGRHAADWLFCRDDKWRPVEPGTFPLAHAAPARVGRLRAYGNALDAETAQVFIESVMDCELVL